jgi:hypothetical protein
MSPDPAGDLERLRAIALALPRAAEKVSHGQPIFFIERGKVFAHYWHDHHGDGRSAVMVKTSGPDEQALLIEADPELYYRPAYIGHSGWIAIRTDRPHGGWDHIADRVAMSWRRVAPAKLLEVGPK